MLIQIHRGHRVIPVILLLTGLLVAAPAAVRQEAAASKGKNEPSRMLASGDACRMNSRPAEALLWYRQAALAGSMDAVYRVGSVLLSGEDSHLPRQSVPRDVPEGVRWIFRAATNMHPQACRGMSRIYRDGLGVKTNLVQAYAWLRLFAELELTASAAELDKLALKLDARCLLEAQALAAQFKNRQWPPTPCKRIVEGDERLALSGLTVGERGALAVINRRTFAEGESAELAIANGRLIVTCCEIREQSVLVDIAGEDEARLLSFR